MAQNKVEILLSLKDAASAQFKKTYSGIQGITQRFSDNWKAHWVRNTALIMGAVLALRKLAQTAVGTAKDLIGVANKVEQLGVRLKVLLGSAEEGNKVFEDMTILAGQVPKTYDEIMMAATDLAAVFKGGREEIAKMMPIVVDISAATGIAVQQVVGQVIRMYSAGAASADMFRERGVSAALGFQAGVSYSAEETMKTLVGQWEDGTGKFVGASKELATTFTGMVSMMQDAWFIFRRDIGTAMFETVKADLGAILKLIEQSKEEGGAYGKVVQDLRKFFDDAYVSAKNFVSIIVVSGGQAIDIFNNIRLAIQRATNVLDEFVLGITDFINFFPRLFGVTESALQTFRENLHFALSEGYAKESELLNSATEDYSTNFATRLESFKLMLEEMKAAAAEANAGIVDNTKAGVKEQEKEQKKMWTTAKKLSDNFSSGVSGMFVDMVKGIGDATEAFKKLGWRMVQTLVDFIVQKGINLAMSETMKATTTATAAIQGAAMAKAYAPAAAMASLASFGANAAPAGAALTSITALAHALALPKAAEGAIVNKPTLLLAGERGREAIVPLEEGGGFGFRDINIYVDANVSSSVDIPLLAEELGFYIEREVSRARTIG